MRIIKMSTTDGEAVLKMLRLLIRAHVNSVTHKKKTKTCAIMRMLLQTRPNRESSWMVMQISFTSAMNSI